MKVLVRQLGIWLLLASCAAAQDSATDLVVLRDILVSENSGRPQIELVLTAPVEPSTTTAVNPNRLIIELPNTIDGSNLPKMQVKSGGVRTIEIV
ncbi:MAG TPA: AMIN domain-containing protein, partial [Terriglobales bacterium]|nr:AMIN domain-containing protein [Terriglobales bacterium]